MRACLSVDPWIRAPSPERLNCRHAKRTAFSNYRQAGGAHPKVQINKYFVSEAETNFFRVLRNVVGDRAHILAQVSVGRLLWMPGNDRTNPGWSKWRNKISARSVDFVLCDSVTLRPRLVIELDESTHARPMRQTRDEEVEAILTAAGLPYLRVLTSRMYDMRELSETILPYLR